MYLILEGNPDGGDGLRPAAQRNEGGFPDGDLEVMDSEGIFSKGHSKRGLPLPHFCNNSYTKGNVPSLCRLLPPFLFFSRIVTQCRSYILYPRKAPEILFNSPPAASE